MEGGAWTNSAYLYVCIYACMYVDMPIIHTRHSIIKKRVSAYACVVLGIVLGYCDQCFIPRIPFLCDGYLLIAFCGLRVDRCRAISWLLHFFKSTSFEG